MEEKKYIMKKLGFGFMRLPKTNPDDETSINYDEVNKMAELFMKSEFNYFDTAYPYHQGKSEEALKKAVVENYPTRFIHNIR